MEVLRTGVAWTEFFQIHMSTFEEAVEIASNAKLNVKATRYGTHGHHMGSLNRPGPMDLTMLKATIRASNFERATQHL